MGVHGTPRRSGGGFAKLVVGNVEDGEAPTLFRELVEIRLDENLDGLFAGINLDTNRRVAKVHLVASSVRSSNDGVGHYRLAFQGSAATSEIINGESPRLVSGVSLGSRSRSK